MKIQDQALQPYEIHVNSNSYDVVKGTNKDDKDGNEIFNNVAFCTSMQGAIHRIVREKIIKEKILSLNGFLKKYEAIKNEIINAVNLK
jgi:hypothetical protein